MEEIARAIPAAVTTKRDSPLQGRGSDADVVAGEPTRAAATNSPKKKTKKKKKRKKRKRKNQKQAGSVP